jgi:hypothetical protein
MKKKEEKEEKEEEENERSKKEERNISPMSSSLRIEVLGPPLRPLVDLTFSLKLIL